MRSQQREATRQRIVDAALQAISESGFEVSTRSIANLANVSQGLLTYHFKSKEELWRAAADQLFTMHNQSLKAVVETCDSNDPRELRRETIRQLVRFNAEHPEFFRFMMQNGSQNNDRSRWLVDTHLRPFFKQFSELMGSGIPEDDLPHAFYVLAGAAGTIFSAPNECKRLTGITATTRNAITRHADYVADLIVP